jgi:hypothetical protein
VPPAAAWRWYRTATGGTTGQGVLAPQLCFFLFFLLLYFPFLFFFISLMDTNPK